MLSGSRCSGKTRSCLFDLMALPSSLQASPLGRPPKWWHRWSPTGSGFRCRQWHPHNSASRCSIGWLESQDWPIVWLGVIGRAGQVFGQDEEGMGRAESSGLKVGRSILLEQNLVLLLKKGTTPSGLASRADSSTPPLTTRTSPRRLCASHLPCCSCQSRMNISTTVLMHLFLPLHC